MDDPKRLAVESTLEMMVEVAASLSLDDYIDTTSAQPNTKRARLIEVAKHVRDAVKASRG